MRGGAPDRSGWESWPLSLEIPLLDLSEAQPGPAPENLYLGLYRLRSTVHVCGLCFGELKVSTKLPPMKTGVLLTIRLGYKVKAITTFFVKSLDGGRPLALRGNRLNTISRVQVARHV